MRVRACEPAFPFPSPPTEVGRLRDLVKDRNAPQKHVWRAQMVLLSAEGAGVNAIMRETGKSKTCVWRWQERFAAEAVVARLLLDKTRFSRIPKFDASIGARVALTIVDKPRDIVEFYLVSPSLGDRIAPDHRMLPAYPRACRSSKSGSASGAHEKFACRSQLSAGAIRRRGCRERSQ